MTLWHKKPNVELNTGNPCTEEVETGTHLVNTSQPAKLNY